MSIDTLQAKINQHRELTERNATVEADMLRETKRFTDAALNESVTRTLISEFSALAGNQQDRPPNRPDKVDDIDDACNEMRRMYMYRSEQVYLNITNQLRDQESPPLRAMSTQIKEFEREHRENEKRIDKLFREIKTDRERFDLTYRRFVERIDVDDEN
ncbi:hypothetical protein SARC_06419 [Sphaeroforma arctica JP610]|uniref:Uncharacterized protein n=1 Tax=Sphaeroforma arctica JP610 TaxID=667725 RepID=A0A0L0FX75_9EUKA|nr:hypothetical protein SARC_06419 [Sphaeroforma arctica JP610]KNC81244.1 hypothetical protein SARC_06419 [Sphaeroforma arctica JP610]|eukprot:XP_014155146.1 hypothetical protein SARC_06419 [Sphaeroforma arctica JP610]